MKKLLLLLPVMLVFVGTAVRAQDPTPLPTVPPHSQPPFVYHLDPPGADFYFPANAWPMSFQWNFTDALNSPPNPWHWETEWRNPNPTADTLLVYYNLAGFTQAGQLILPPGGSAVIEWIVFEVPEVGAWTYGTWPPQTGKNRPTYFDVSICEGATHPTSLPPEWTDLPTDTVLAHPHYTVTVTAPIPSLSTWGIIVLVLLLLTSAALIIRRRRSEA